MTAVPADIVPIPLTLTVIVIIVIGLAATNTLPVILAALIAFSITQGLGLVGKKISDAIEIADQRRNLPVADQAKMSRPTGRY